MRNRLFNILLCILAGNSFLLQAQPLSRYHTFSYSVNDGLLQSTIMDMVFDKNNFCWLSFPNGIQKFDGSNFINIPLQSGLPDDKHCRFFRMANGDLLVSHVQGISRYDLSTDKFIQIYTHKHRYRQPAFFVGECGGTVYFYTGNGYITGINNKSFEIKSNTPTGWGSYDSNPEFYPQVSSNIIDHTVAFIYNKTIYTWDLQAGKLTQQSAQIKGISNYFLRMKSKSEILYFSYEPLGTLQVYHTTAHSSKPLPIKGLEHTFISRCKIHYWNDKWLLSINGRIFETDSTFQVIRKEIVNFQNQPPAEGLSIANILEDNFGNLLLQTITGGIRKIIRNNYPLKYYNTGEAGKNFIVSVFPDKQNNRILAGAIQNGLLVFDTLQRLIKHIMITGDNGWVISPNIILKKPNGHFLLFAPSESKVWELNSELEVIGPVSIQNSVPDAERSADFFGNFLWQKDNEAIVQTQSKLFRVLFKSNAIISSRFSGAYIMGGIYQNDRIISHGNDELIITDARNFSVLRKIPLKNTGNVRCFAQDDEGNILAGTNKGIFITDISGKVKKQISKESGLPDECIYAMAFDEKKNVWCSTNKGILNLKDGKLIGHLKKDDGLQENEFNTNVVAKSSDGELFFGGVNGISSFYPAHIIGHIEDPILLFTRILANNENAAVNSATWNLQKIELPYTSNSLSFDFVAMGCFNPDQYLYQYRMTGVDKGWIQNNGLQTVRYSLPPGKYVFQVFASRAYNDDPIPMRELLIIIHPPFWKTWWFVSAFIMALLILLGYSINLRNKRAFAKQLQHLENERQLNEERERISKDLHDSLGAYANAVLYNTELLEKQNSETRRMEVLSDLKFASRDIITSLRETVWALKKETYTAEDCLLRIRNFIQPLARYYSHVHFGIQGEAPPLFNLHYSDALNLVRIIQEAVTNSIKHSSTSTITITSYYNNQQWTLEVCDTGKGFNMSILNEEKGNGLYNMKQRAAESGFLYHLNTKIDTGTQITIVIQR